MAGFDAPQSRNEAILQNILGADNVLLPPQSRNEAILQNILGADNVLLPPQSRIEELLMQLLEEWPVGPQEVPENDVNFYDYDGSIVASYTAAQFAALEEMPENPDHTADGLTSQGWNWSFANAKTYVAKYGKLNIGQMYVPTDGKTHVFINIPADDPSYETTLYFGHTAASGQTVIDWGDGSPTETASGESAAEHSHTYANPGKYEITLDTVSGGMDIRGSTQDGVAPGRNDSSFLGKGNVSSICSSDAYIYLSDKLTSIGNCAFVNCYSIRRITIPNTVTSIGKYAFNCCESLQSITIPNTVTSIGPNSFSSCYRLQSIHIPNETTDIGANSIQNCRRLKSVTFPDSAGSLGVGSLSGDYSLEFVVVPDSMTNIGKSMFSGCTKIRNLTLPSSIIEIGGYAFNGCWAMSNYHFKSPVPPTLSNTNAFLGIPTDTVFYVPADSIEAYKTANNWSTYADRMVAE